MGASYDGIGRWVLGADMEPQIRAWNRWLRALEDFYDYGDTDGVGRVYEVHRRSIHPTMQVCREWGSLLLNDRTTVACDEQACTEWLAPFFSSTGFMAAVQECAFVTRAFWRGRAVDQVQLYHKGAGGVIFSPNETIGTTAGAMGSSRPSSSPLESKPSEGTYRIVTVCFDRNGNRIEPEGVCLVYDTGSSWPPSRLSSPPSTIRGWT